MTETLERGTLIGLTGDISKDGILTPEQQEELDRIQQGAAYACMTYLDVMEPSESFPLVAMATGVGKGKIIHELIVRQKALKPDSKILIIVGTRNNLIAQTADALAGYQQEEEEGFMDADEDVELEEMDFEVEGLAGYTFDKYGNRDVDVQLATFQKIQNRYKARRLNTVDFDLVIVDEVHNVGTQARFNSINDFARVVGFTATPHRFSGAMRSPQSYGFEIIASLPLPEAQERRILPPLYALQINTVELLPEDQIPVTITGRIDLPKLEKILKVHPELREFVAERATPIINHDGRRYKTVAAVNFVWEAIELARCFRDRGISVGLAINQNAARSIHSEEIPALDTIRRYKLPEGDPESLQMLISPYIIGEGFDVPATEILMWASPTSSHLRYTQYTGRLARRHFGKAYGLVIDCLYQTSQYDWTYNFAMWMKGYVRQLPNGLLYLGPESEEARDLESLRGMHELSDNVDIRDLQREGILGLKETDTPLNQKGITILFVGNYDSLILLVREVIKELSRDYPEYFAKRINGTRIIDVITSSDGKQSFITAMVERGVQVKHVDAQEIQMSDIPLSKSDMRRIFIGHPERTFPITQRIKSALKAEHPEYFAWRKRTWRTGEIEKVGEIEVVTAEGRQAFMEAANLEGLQFKDLKVAIVKKEDLVISRERVALIFIQRTRGLLLRTALGVMRDLSVNYPEYFIHKKSGTRDVYVVTEQGRGVFIETMLKEGFELRPNVEEIKESDLSLTRGGLRRVFKGEYSRLQPIVENVHDELSRQHPDYFAKRKSGFHPDIDVVTENGRQAFIEAMMARGIMLKNNG